MQNTNFWTIPLAILAGGIIVAGAVYFSMKGPSTEGKPELLRPVTSEDRILGNPAARIMIVEYSDFECQYCKQFHETLKQIVANEGADGDVAWVFRHLPLSEIHQQALPHARAAECAAIAGGSEGFWKFSDALFAAQPADPSKYGEYAQAAGLGSEFASCVANPPPSVNDRIRADRKNALDMGARGTPYSVILKNGQYVTTMSGAYTYDALKAIVQQALAQ